MFLRSPNEIRTGDTDAMPTSAEPYLVFVDPIRQTIPVKKLREQQRV
jgi:hypothetical protein